MRDISENQALNYDEIVDAESNRSYAPTARKSIRHVGVDGSKEGFSIPGRTVADYKNKVSTILLRKRREDQSSSLRMFKLLGIFLVVMLVFTLISRSAYTLSLPQVETTKLAAMPITHRVNLDGILGANEKVIVPVQMGIMISAVFVKDGDMVEEGQLLFRYDHEALDEQITQASAAVAKAEFALQEAKDGVELAEQQRQVSIARAQEDYALAKENGVSNVARTEAAMLEARSLYNEQPADDLLRAYEEAKSAYEASVQSAEESERAAARALDDAYSIAVVGSSQVGSLSLDLDEANRALSKLVELQDTSGEVYASTKGIVADLSVVVGSEASGPSAMLVMDSSQGYRLECVASPDQARYIDIGDEVTVTFSGDAKGYNTTIAGKAESTSQAGWYIVSTDVPADYAAGSSTAHLRCVKSGGRYPAVVPTGSIVSFSENGNQAQCVFVLDEENTVLGIETVARRVDVDILEQSDQYVAVEGAISEDQRIVSSSNRELNEGDRVREVIS